MHQAGVQMNLSEIRTTLRDRIIEELEYTENEAAFDVLNIPVTLEDESFHINVPSGSKKSFNMHDLVIDNTVTITLWRRGFRQPVEAFDAGLEAIFELITCLSDVVFRTSPPFRNVTFENYQIEPIANDNENTVKMTINFTVQVSMAVTVQPTT